MNLVADKNINWPYKDDILSFAPLSPADGLKDEVIRLMDKYGIEMVLSCFEVKHLLKNKRVRWAIDVRVKKGMARRELNRTLNINMGFGVLVALVHSEVVESLARMPDNPLKALNGVQLHCLLCGWSHSVINQGVFNTRNIVKFGQYQFSHMNDAIKRLEEIGYLEVVTPEQIYRKTKKIPRNPKYKYMRITRIGEKLLKHYFDLYTIKHKEFTGEYWNVELETFDKFKNYEQI